MEELTLLSAWDTAYDGLATILYWFVIFALAANAIRYMIMCFRKDR